ncbi:MarR family transcriptional regulator [Microbacterium sorbitolivorans]|uniref:MarR family transcriptional regulator n=1 Tax=Microbacterium sorbitolivorans TaxID=1867410 RepID=A0A367Y1T1_9MICO|nr:MarR family transcriptional regulator [Microbacterium sorbitolivorans]RCK59823.1 MarR family transcriptional regulator [Microbacterium sorbitolivorans]GGF40300.1 MarR family transcriptional regulator [Microbacterium sorbitolivorans]
MSNEKFRTEVSDVRAATLRLARRIRQQRSVKLMTDGQFAVLVALHLHGPHTLTALAERDGVTAPSMNRTVNALIEHDYVSRVTDPTDRRKVQIAISEAGSQVVTDTVERRDMWLSQVLENMTEAERSTLHEAAQIILREVHK